MQRTGIFHYQNILSEEPIHAVISEYQAFGTYVWIDYADGEELARTLEDYGLPVIRVRGPYLNETPQGNKKNQ